MFLDALNTGHHGSLTTIHANGAEDALRRLAQLASRGTANVWLKDTEEECRRSINLVAHIERRDKLRMVEEIYQAS